MFKLSNSKILVTLVIVTLLAVLVGGTMSYATEIVATTTSTNTENTTNTENKENTSNTNTSSSVDLVSATVNNTANTNTNKATNTNTNTNTNKTTNTNTNKVSNTNTNSTKLPYAGSSEGIVFVVIALIASAGYAYKKVTDYNV